MEPLVSVIVPVYNVHSYLRESLDSLLDQTYKNLEIIIIDDGSTDGSGELCDEYGEKDTRVVVIHQPNRGISAARNAGLEIFKGDYVAFLDSDDALDSCFVEKSISSLLSSDADMVICRTSLHTTTESLASHKPEKFFPLIEKGIYDRNSVIQYLLDDTLDVSIWNKLYKRSLWDEIRFNEGHVFEDIETFYRICSFCSNVSVLTDVLYLHRKRPYSITTVFTQEYMEDAILASARTESFIRDNVPDLFSDDQLMSYDRKYVTRILVHYLQANEIADEKIKEYREDLKRRLFDAVNDHGISDFDLRFRIVYRMVRVCPWLLDRLVHCYSVLS